MIALIVDRIFCTYHGMVLDLATALEALLLIFTYTGQIFGWIRY